MREGPLLGIRKCENCGVDVEIRHRKRLEANYVCCSPKCAGEYRKKQTPNNCVCPICNKEFHIKPSQIAKCKKNYCSRECHRIAKMEYMSGEKNHQYGLRGSNNPTWKSDYQITKYGYRMVRKPNHPFCTQKGWMLEHRLVAEKYLLNEENSLEIEGKRYLKPELEVHHKDFNKLNNEPNNLVILTKQEHMSLHAKLLNIPRNKTTGRFEVKNMNIKVKRLKENAVMPTRGSADAAGYDLYANNDVEFVIPPHSTQMLMTDLAFEIPQGYFGGIFARSGLSTKKGLRPSTCVSVIDSDYRGNVGLPIHNDTDIPQTVVPHERVAQLVIIPIPNIKLVEVNDLSDTDRGANGFGSTGTR